MREYLYIIDSNSVGKTTAVALENRYAIIIYFRFYILGFIYCEWTGSISMKYEMNICCWNNIVPYRYVWYWESSYMYGRRSGDPNIAMKTRLGSNLEGCCCQGWVILRKNFLEQILIFLIMWILWCFKYFSIPIILKCKPNMGGQGYVGIVRGV